MIKPEDKTFDIYLNFCGINNLKPGRFESLQFFNKRFAEAGGKM